MPRTTHSDKEIAAAATRFDELLAEPDPEELKVDNIEDLRAIAAAQDALAAAEATLVEAVAVARAHGRSWNRIAIPLGVTRQAARQRFAGDESTPRSAGKRAAPRKAVAYGRPVKAGTAKQVAASGRRGTGAAKRAASKMPVRRRATG